MDGQPPYIYGGQWADELASAYTMTMKSAPALAHDVAGLPIPKEAKNDIMQSVMGADVNPYGG